LAKTGKAGVVKVALRTRESLALIRPRGDLLVMDTMLWPDEVRSPDFASLGEDQHATDKELAMAHLLVDQLAGDYDPEEYEDDYAQAVEALVKAKVEGGEVKDLPKPAEETGEVVDLLAALAKSVEKAKASRGESVAEPEKAPAKKVVAKKKAG